MNILTVGLDKTTLDFLLAQGFQPDRADTEDFLLVDWLNEASVFEVAVVNLKHGGTFMCREVRAKNNGTPVIGVFNPEADKDFSDARATFLENGGDDLLRHPVNPRELAASIRAIVRRRSAVLLDIFTVQCGPFTIKLNHPAQLLTINNERIYLTNKEYTLMSQLLTNPNRVLSKETIMNYIYGTGHEGDEPEMKIVDVFVCKVRRKLDIAVEKGGSIIETEWGRGYRLRGDLIKKEGLAA